MFDGHVRSERVASCCAAVMAVAKPRLDPAWHSRVDLLSRFHLGSFGDVQYCLVSMLTLRRRMKMPGHAMPHYGTVDEPVVHVSRRLQSSSAHTMSCGDSQGVIHDISRRGEPTRFGQQLCSSEPSKPAGKERARYEDSRWVPTNAMAYLTRPISRSGQNARECIITRKCVKKLSGSQSRPSGTEYTQ